jgi:Leucine-rich repeat (LRR) protein
MYSTVLNQNTQNFFQQQQIIPKFFSETRSMTYRNYLSCNKIGVPFAPERILAFDTTHLGREIDDQILGEIIEKFPNLETLTLYGNQITNKGISKLTELKNLKALHLHCDLLTDKDLLVIGQLSKLETLTSDSLRNVTEDGIQELQSLSNLQSLCLGYCPGISDKTLDGIGRLPNLKTLKLAACDITNSGLHALTKSSRLQELHLHSCTLITDAGLEALQKSPLQKLTLSFSNIKNEGLSHLKQCPLTHLSLNNGKNLEDAGLEHLIGLPLEELDIGKCTKITDVGLQYISELTKLTSLKIKHCNKVTNAGIERLTSLSRLKTLNLSGVTQITHYACMDLRTLPLEDLNLRSIRNFGNLAIAMLFMSLPTFDKSGQLVYTFPPPLKRLKVRGCTLSPSPPFGRLAFPQDLPYIRSLFPSVTIS